MHWPFMRRSVHEATVAGINRLHSATIASLIRADNMARDEVVRNLTTHFQGLVDAEYFRARDEGRAQVHRWAVEVNHAVFMGDHPWQGTQRQRATTALQYAEQQFDPTRTQLAITQGEN